MADCTRGEIPDKLIEDKGFFKCINPVCGNSFVPTSDEYTPSEEDVIATVIPFNQNFASLSYPALYAALGTQIILKSVAFEDEYMSWASDPITVEDAPISNFDGYNADFPTNSFYYWGGDPQCNGLYVIGGWPPNELPGQSPQFFIHPPKKMCGGATGYNPNPFYGQSINTGWFGSTLQFFLNIYKVYCCVKDKDGNVIDYDYSYYYTEMHNRDGVLCLDSYGPIFCSFCGYFLNGGKYHIQSNNYPDNYLIQSYDIPMKLEELP